MLGTGIHATKFCEEFILLCNLILVMRTVVFILAASLVFLLWLLMAISKPLVTYHIDHEFQLKSTLKGKTDLLTALHRQQED